MSRKTTNSKTKRIQFEVEKGTKDFEVIEKIETLFPNKKRTDSIKQALFNYTNLFALFDAKNLDQLMSKIKGKIVI